MTTTDPTIWKFPFHLEDEVELRMPQEARILHVGIDPAAPRLALWAAIDPKVPAVTRTIRVRGTGHPLGQADPGAHLGTVIQHGFVWHIFDGGEA